MMFGLGHHQVLVPCLAVGCDPLAAIVDFDITAALAHPYRSARVLPRHRVAAPVPGYVSVARHFAQLVIDIAIRRLSVQRLQTQPIHLPALDQKLGTLLRMHEEAFRQLGGVPEEILYHRMKTVWLETDERGEIVWNPVFLDFARYWGFKPRLCRPYRAQTKGKVECGVKYIRRNFLCGLQGREPSGLTDLNAQLRAWVWEVAKQRVHGSTHEAMAGRCFGHHRPAVAQRKGEAP